MFVNIVAPAKCDLQLIYAFSYDAHYENSMVPNALVSHIRK